MKEWKKCWDEGNVKREEKREKRNDSWGDCVPSANDEDAIQSEYQIQFPSEADIS